MNTTVIISKTWVSPDDGEYVKYELPDSVTYNAYKTFYFVSASGEVAILDCFNKIPEGIESIKKIFDKLIREEYKVEHFRVNSLRQGAWRYFADISANNDIWYKHHMSGSPFKKKLTDEELEKIKLVEKKEFTVELQEITYKKWLSLSEEEELKQMRLFLDSPIKSSDYIFDHTFHTKA